MREYFDEHPMSFYLVLWLIAVVLGGIFGDSPEILRAQDHVDSSFIKHYHISQDVELEVLERVVRSLETIDGD